MNLEIQKFWEDCGYTIKFRPDISYVADAWKDDKKEFLAVCVITNNVLMYRWANDTKSPGLWYSEEEMLKIVRLKAFL